MTRKKNYISFVVCIFFLCSLNTIAQQNYSQTGEASFYSDKFSGRYTASGEIYMPEKLTAAHLTLPFNTQVKVTNLANNKSVVVKINDRGPYIRGRIIDLSKAAAQQLDFIDAGTAKVIIEVIKQNTDENSSASSTEINNNTAETATQLIVPTKQNDNTINADYYQLSVNKTDVSGYGVQLASYRESANLLQMASEIKQKLQENIIVQVAKINNDKVYRILVGPYPSKTKAEQLQQSIKIYYPQCFVVDLSRH